MVFHKCYPKHDKLVDIFYNFFNFLFALLYLFALCFFFLIFVIKIILFWKLKLLKFCQSDELRRNLLSKYIEEDRVDQDVLGSRRTSGLKMNTSGSSLDISGNTLPLNSSTHNPFNLKDLEEHDDKDLGRLVIQCELNNQGASDLVVDLFMSDISNKVFKENVLLAIALLEGGNTQVQVIT